MSKCCSAFYIRLFTQIIEYTESSSSEEARCTYYFIVFTLSDFFTTLKKMYVHIMHFQITLNIE